MEDLCKTGESDMADFRQWWEAQQPAWMVAYIRKGEAKLSLHFNAYPLRPGMLALVSPDMYPSLPERSEDFEASYALIDHDFAEEASYGMPNDFFDVVYRKPLLQAGCHTERWLELLKSVADDRKHPFRKEMLSKLWHGFFLDYFRLWQQQYGDLSPEREMNQAEALCTKFYSLVFAHFRTHRDVAFYAGQLCITPNYLAMLVRQVCNESPKQAIDRQVILEIKHLLQHSGFTAGQIADRLHFPDTSYMCRFFRKQTGLSLSEFRKSG